MLVHILCAMRDRRAAQRIRGEMDDGEHCMVELVSDGAAALERCYQRMPDILVLDAVLPGMDGLGVMDCLRDSACAPRVIGGSMMPFSDEGFRMRGAQAVVHVPWQDQELIGALRAQLEAIKAHADWQQTQRNAALAGSILREMGMRDTLKGFAYLSFSAALAYENESSLFAVGERLYAPVAAYHHTTAQNVERLIRHAIESTMSAARARGVYSLFGNTIDPAKGKPTNAQVIALIMQRMRVTRQERNGSRTNNLCEE